MWSLGGRAAAVRPNSSEPPPGSAREGRGKGAGVLGDWFWAIDGGGEAVGSSAGGGGPAAASAVGVPARWGCAGDLGKVWGLEWVPKKVGESLLGCAANRARSSTAAASNGAGDGSVRGTAGTRRARPFYRGRACLPATQETHGDV
jgi:hypothetical protein